MAELSWLGVVRHGESTANVASEVAEATGREELEISVREADVPLSPAGEAQARALGRWLAGLARQHRPEVVVSSTYLRAIRTAELAVAGLAGAGPGLPVRLDERLRDREMGVLEMLTRYGAHSRYPQETARRTRQGEFYYRPPGGEAWTDMALRLRGFLCDLRDAHSDRRVLIFAHEAVVLLLRYIIEDLTEAGIWEIAVPRIGNASLTCWAREDDRLRLITFNDMAHLSDAGSPAADAGFPAAPAG